MTRHDHEQELWRHVEQLGAKNVLQHVLDDMPMSKLTKLLAWVQREVHTRNSPAPSPEEDAIGVLVTLGEPRGRVVEWMEKVKADLGDKRASCNALVTLLLAERNRR